jgi:hypothetical protein
MLGGARIGVAGEHGAYVTDISGLYAVPVAKQSLHELDSDGYVAMVDVGDTRSRAGTYVDPKDLYADSVL